MKVWNLPLSLLEAITNNFSDDQEIGRGGFAVVYKVSVNTNLQLIDQVCFFPNCMQMLHKLIFMLKNTTYKCRFPSVFTIPTDHIIWIFAIFLETFLEYLSNTSNQTENGPIILQFGGVSLEPSAATAFAIHLLLSRRISIRITWHQSLPPLGWQTLHNTSQSQRISLSNLFSLGLKKQAD